LRIVDCGSEVEAEAEVEGEQGVGCDARWPGEAGSWQLAASGRESKRVENVDQNGNDFFSSVLSIVY
jgi:hypothetical protein